MKCRQFYHKMICVSACVLLILTSGCMRSPEAGEPGGPAPAVVEIWHYLQGAEEETLQEQVRRIAAKHPEVLIKLKFVAEANFESFSYQAEAGGAGPEIFIASREIIRQLYERGMLAKAAYVDQGAYPAAQAAFQFESAAYASPWLTDIPLLYFRTDLAGVPENLEDLFVNKGGVSLAAANTFSLVVWWSALGGRAVNAGVPALEDSGNLVFLQQLLAWQTAQGLRIDPNVLDSFAGGQTLFMIAGASQAKALTQQGVPWGSMQLSDVTGGQGQPLIGSTMGIANSAIKTTEALMPAIQLVEKELLTAETEGAMERAGVLLPANSGFYQLSEAQKGVFPQANIALNRALALEGGALEWKVFPGQNFAWSKALAGELTPEAALAAAQEEALKALDLK